MKFQQKVIPNVYVVTDVSPTRYRITSSFRKELARAIAYQYEDIKTGQEFDITIISDGFCHVAADLANQIRHTKNSYVCVCTAMGKDSGQYIVIPVRSVDTTMRAEVLELLDARELRSPYEVLRHYAETCSHTN